jgi:hypothetical protein
LQIAKKEYLKMSLDQFAALLQQLREMSDAELTQALANCTKNLRNLEPFTPDYNTCRHVVETVKSHVEMRKAQAGRTDSDWGWLLSSILGAYSFEPSSALAAALKPYALSVPWPPAFYDNSGQAVLQIQMAQDDVGQIERILKGFETLTPFLVPGRHGYEFRLKTSQVKSRAKSWITVQHDGATTIVAAHKESKYPSFRAALEHIAHDLYWKEPPEPIPKASKARRTPSTTT